MRCGLILLFAAALHAQTEIATVKATTPVAPPSWAALERQLIRAMEEAAPVYLKRFTRPGGSLYGEGPVVQLVSLSTVESRKLMVQAGAFGEHQFTTVKHAGRVPAD